MSAELNFSSAQAVAATFRARFCAASSGQGEDLVGPSQLGLARVDAAKPVQAGPVRGCIAETKTGCLPKPMCKFNIKEK